ncbi:hypothetical protein HQ544_03020 [Candidatus Falkowbacteria bacterium]|nr:hypothetical protein [Candidatus Falkowbacteria bacterium]
MNLEERRVHIFDGGKKMIFYRLEVRKGVPVAVQGGRVVTGELGKWVCAWLLFFRQCVHPDVAARN